MNASWAAVALILRDSSANGPEFLAIRRSRRAGDPWSGQMALPGGRHAAVDVDLCATAARETHEEVGLDLVADGIPIGKLDDLQAVSRGRPVDLIISPFVYELTTPRHTSLDPREVDAAYWIPVGHLIRQDPQRADTVTHRPYTEHGFPAFEFAGNSIWGLTYRILNTFLIALERDPAIESVPR